MKMAVQNGKNLSPVTTDRQVAPENKGVRL